MSYRNPITSLPADAITSGNLSGQYRVTGAITLAGNPAASHVQASATSLVFTAADGETPLITMDTAAGAGAITGATITGGLFRTAPAGARWELANTFSDTLRGYTGDPAEVTPGQLLVGPTPRYAPGGGGLGGGYWTTLSAPNLVVSQLPARVAVRGVTALGNGNNNVELSGEDVSVLRTLVLTGALPVQGARVHAQDTVLAGTGSAVIPAGGSAIGTVAVQWRAGAAHPLGPPTFAVPIGGLYTGNTLVIGTFQSLTAIGATARMQLWNGGALAAGQTLPFSWLAVWT